MISWSICATTANVSSCISGATRVAALESDNASLRSSAAGLQTALAQERAALADLQAYRSAPKIDSATFWN